MFDPVKYRVCDLGTIQHFISFKGQPSLLTKKNYNHILTVFTLLSCRHLFYSRFMGILKLISYQEQNQILIGEPQVFSLFAPKFFSPQSLFAGYTDECGIF